MRPTYISFSYSFLMHNKLNLKEVTLHLELPPFIESELPKPCHTTSYIKEPWILTTQYSTLFVSGPQQKLISCSAAGNHVLIADSLCFCSATVQKSVALRSCPRQLVSHFTGDWHCFRSCNKGTVIYYIVYNLRMVLKCNM